MPYLKYFGHSCLQITEGDTTLLFDPFITDNPFQVAKKGDLHCSYILVSHAHFDHLGDTVYIAKNNDATVISTAEVANLCGEQGCKCHGMHIGGTHEFSFGKVRITPAFHGAGVPGGHACGFIVSIGGKTLYFAGDTSIFGDMALLGRLESIDVALLPIGDNFTMGPSDALEAVGLLSPKAVIPVHYNTWSLIEQSPEQFKTAVEDKYHIPVRILNPGDSTKL